MAGEFFYLDFHGPRLPKPKSQTLAMKKITFLFASLLSFSASSSEIDATWSQGAFMLPPVLASQISSPKKIIAKIDRFADKFKLIVTEEKIPVAIVMHGCSGITSENAAAARLLSSMGFAVFLPNYYARSNVSAICAGSASGVPFFADISQKTLSLRVEEFDNAMREIKLMNFIDNGKVLAYGHSFGGGTVAALDRSDIKAAIITGWGCPSPSFSKQSHPIVPQLAIRFKNDPWLSSGWECNARAFGGRDASNTTSLVLNGQETHEVLHDARAQEAVREFVQKHFNQ